MLGFSEPGLCLDLLTVCVARKGEAGVMLLLLSLNKFSVAARQDNLFDQAAAEMGIKKEGIPSWFGILPLFQKIKLEFSPVWAELLTSLSSML